MFLKVALKKMGICERFIPITYLWTANTGCTFTHLDYVDASRSQTNLVRFVKILPVKLSWCSTVFANLVETQHIPRVDAMAFADLSTQDANGRLLYWFVAVVVSLNETCDTGLQRNILRQDEDREGKTLLR
mmetsp:Transcript_11581/g.22789  ORF Transcript_11581/g.22789 Transcript_11581/m.22789 type:complete len:131 (+) Transcript_11581:178-570(+)